MAGSLLVATPSPVARIQVTVGRGAVAGSQWPGHSGRVPSGRVTGARAPWPAGGRLLRSGTVTWPLSPAAARCRSGRLLAVPRSAGYHPVHTPRNTATTATLAQQTAERSTKMINACCSGRSRLHASRRDGLGPRGLPSGSALGTKSFSLRIVDGAGDHDQSRLPSWGLAGSSPAVRSALRQPSFAGGTPGSSAGLHRKYAQPFRRPSPNILLVLRSAIGIVPVVADGIPNFGASPDVRWYSDRRFDRPWSECSPALRSALCGIPTTVPSVGSRVPDSCRPSPICDGPPPTGALHGRLAAVMTQ